MDDIGGRPEEPENEPEGCRFTADQREQMATQAAALGEQVYVFMARRAVQAFAQARLQLVGVGIKSGPDNQLEPDD